MYRYIYIYMFPIPGVFSSLLRRRRPPSECWPQDQPVLLIKGLFPFSVTHHLERTFPTAPFFLTGTFFVFSLERCSFRAWISL